MSSENIARVSSPVRLQVERRPTLRTDNICIDSRQFIFELVFGNIGNGSSLNKHKSVTISSIFTQKITIYHNFI